MQTPQTSLFHRHDTILGACEGVGEDFGVDAQILRIALAGLFFWNPAVALGAYAMIAAAVFTSRRLWPVPDPTAETSVVALPRRRSPEAPSIELATAA